MFGSASEPLEQLINVPMILLALIELFLQSDLMGKQACRLRGPSL